MTGFVRWGCTLLAPLIVVVWLGSGFVRTQCVHDKLGVGIERGYFTIGPAGSGSPGFQFEWTPFRVDHALGLALTPAAPFGLNFSIWMLALPVGFLALWMWEARLRRRVGVLRWMLSAVCLCGVFVWWTSQWTYYGAAGWGARVSVVAKQVSIEDHIAYGPLSLFSHPVLFAALQGNADIDLGWLAEPGVVIWSSDRMRNIVIAQGRREPGIPLIAIIGPLVAITGFVWIRAGGRRRVGCCGKCGYDLRGSGAVCPECGTRRVGVVAPVDRGPEGLR